MRKCIGVLLVVCLMASGAFATNSWKVSTGSWGTASNWSNGVPDGSEQIKILGGNTCTLDVAAVSSNDFLNKISVGTTATQANLNIVAGGSITSSVEIQVAAGSGYVGAITQTGGTLNLNGTSSKDSKLELGYKSSTGSYTISGGTIATNGYSQLLVGASGSANGGIGTFTVDGIGGSISVAKLYVGVQDSAALPCPYPLYISLSGAQAVWSRIRSDRGWTSLLPYIYTHAGPSSRSIGKDSL